MSKASWDDTPPVRRLLARLKREIPPAVDLDQMAVLHNNGFQLEYDGSPVAVGAGGGLVPMDTVYTSDTDYHVSRPLSSTFEHDLWRVDAYDGVGYGLVIKQAGLWHIRYLADFDSPLTKAAMFGATGAGESWLPAGATCFDVECVAAISTFTGNVSFLGVFDDADAGLHYTYCWISFTPIALTGKPIA